MSDDQNPIDASLSAPKGNPIDAALAPPETTGEHIAGVIGKLYKGLTGGAGPKIIAGIQSQGPSVLSGVLTGNPALLSRGAPTYHQALDTENQIEDQYAKNHPWEARAVEAVGSLPTFAVGSGIADAAAKAGQAAGEGANFGQKLARAAGYGEKAAGIPARAAQLAKQGAGAGAITGALSTDNPTDLPSNIVTGAGTGAVAAPVAGALLKGAGNIGGRLGLSTLASNAAKGFGTLADKLGLSNVGEGAENVSQALGARGSVNEAAAPRVALANTLQAPEQSGEALLQAHKAETAATAKPLYDAMRADKTLIEDPELREILNDPNFSKPYQQLVNQRARLGHPVTQQVDLSKTPTGFANAGITPEDFQRLVNRPGNENAITQLKGMPSNLSGGSMIDVPDPDILHQLKEVVRSTLTRGQSSTLAMTQKEAESLAPTLQRVTDILHDKSAAARAADAYYTQRMGEQEGLEAGRAFGPKGAATTEGENSPEGATQYLAKPRNNVEKANPQMAADRAAQFRQGAKAAVMDATNTTPIAKPDDILKQSILDNTPQGAKARDVLIPDPVQRAKLEQFVQDQHAAQTVKPSNAGAYNRPVYSPRGLLYRSSRFLLTPKDLVQTPAGQRLVNTAANNPSVLPANVAAASRGQIFLDALRNAATNATVAPATAAYKRLTGGQP